MKLCRNINVFKCKHAWRFVICVGHNKGYFCFLMFKNHHHTKLFSQWTGNKLNAIIINVCLNVFISCHFLLILYSYLSLSSPKQSQTTVYKMNTCKNKKFLQREIFTSISNFVGKALNFLPWKIKVSVQEPKVSKNSVTCYCTKIFMFTQNRQRSTSLQWFYTHFTLAPSLDLQSDVPTAAISLILDNWRQVNSTLRARWLASSEVIRQVLFTSSLILQSLSQTVLHCQL